jgi:hypothetical protein
MMPEIMVTENGIPVPDGVDFDGRVRDERRIRYLKNHLIQVHRAIEQGVAVKGYFHWSMMDNFEWTWGYGQRFGIIRLIQFVCPVKVHQVYFLMLTAGFCVFVSAMFRSLCQVHQLTDWWKLLG